MNVTNNKSEFYNKVGSEKKLYWWVLTNYLEEYRMFPLNAKELIAIYECNEGDLLCSSNELEQQEESFIGLLRTLEIYGYEDIANEVNETTKKTRTSGLY